MRHFSHRVFMRFLLLALTNLLIQTLQAQTSETPSPAQQPSAAALTKAFETPKDQPWNFRSDKNNEPLKLVPANPNGDKANTNAVWDLSHCTALKVSATRKKFGHSIVRLRWVIHSRLGGLYLSAVSDLIPFGNLAEIKIRLDAESLLVPVGHQRPWDSLSAQEITAIELRPECYFRADAVEETLAIELSDVSLVIKPAQTQAASTPASVVDMALTLQPSGSRAVAQISFRIEPPPADPYAADGANSEGDVRLLLPNGKQVLAYLDQDYIEIKEGGNVRYVAAGKPLWRAWLPELPSEKTAQVFIVSGQRRWAFSSDWFQQNTALSQPAPVTTHAAHAWNDTLLRALPQVTTISGGAPQYWELKAIT